MASLVGAGAWDSTPKILEPTRRTTVPRRNSESERAGRAPGPTPGLPQDQSGLSGTQPNATGPRVHSGWTSVAMPAARRAAAVTGLSLAVHATSQ